MLSPKSDVVFFGSSSFAIPSLTGLVGAGYSICVVTVPDKPAGKKRELSPPPLKTIAQTYGLTVLQPTSLKSWNIHDAIADLGDYGIVAAYGKIIPKQVIDAFPKGLINLHPSLLPQYRGPSPIQAVILSGDTVTGVALMLLDEEMDHGPIIARREVEIFPHDTTPTLGERLAQAGAALLIETLPKWLTGTITPTPQDHARATFTKLIETEDGRISWNEPADAIERKLRAYTPWPGIWTTWHGKRVKIIELQVRVHGAPSLLGTISRTPQQTLMVSCGEGDAIEIRRLQLEGKDVLDAKAFLNGHPAIDGSKFE